MHSNPRLPESLSSLNPGCGANCHPRDRWRSSTILVGTFLFIIGALMGEENSQLEGFFFGLLTGVVQMAVIHYFIAKIIGPVGDPGAYWALLGPDVQLRQTRYNFGRAAERIRATQYPQAQEDARNILQPPSEAEMLDLFSRAELR